jgi:hypothetical protein
MKESAIAYAGIRGTSGKPHIGQSLFLPTFEPNTSRIRDRNVTP